ncbi:MAG TPA: YidC/Oxa1 family membrane protein insertase [Candidatus Saccharimonadales bacterium]|nr:YidC/Oxa1 family membrane protein insertase [Candidatus Saccharimonadales bacterium]
MFTTLIVQPIFNLLVFVYAILPGHNFGLALIIFTIIIRLLLWPLVKKQLHQARAMRKLQPELKRIKKEAKGDRQKESVMLMELYKERGINPFGTLPILLIQLVVLIGLYSGLRRVISDPHNLVTFAYPFLQDFSWLQTIGHNIHAFDNTLFGVVNLSRSALSAGGGVYWPAMLIVFGSAVSQYYQAKQLMPSDPDQRKLRDILKAAGEGQQADQAEVNAAVGRSTRFFLPVMIFFFTVNLASALSLYWLTGGVVAYIQQAIVLRRDEEEMEALADGKPVRNVKAIPEAEIVTSKSSKKSSQNRKTAKKRRKR